jgi:hypothetical protein
MSTELEEQFGQFDFTNDSDRGANNLLEFLKYSPNVRALINTVIPEVQELNDEQQTVYSTINIFEAAGSQLDDIFGTLLNLERETGQSDDSYRADLLAQATVLSRSGEIVVLKSIYRNLTMATSVRLYEYQPAHFRIEATVTSIPSTSELEKIRLTMDNSKQGGNGMELSVGVDPIFTLNPSGSTPQLNDPKGLSGGGFVGGTLGTGL